MQLRCTSSSHQSLPELQQRTFSSYKNHNTFKALIGISPSGTVTFMSKLYPGNISNKELTRQSVLLDKLVPGDSIMADKGFDTMQDLVPLGVKLNIPSFLRGKCQLEHHELIEMQRFASLRIHIERRMERIKNYHIFDGTMPLSLVDIADHIFLVCSVLTNFHAPLCLSLRFLIKLIHMYYVSHCIKLTLHFLCIEVENVQPTLKCIAR